MLEQNGVPVAYVVPTTPTGIPAGELAHRWPLLPLLSADDARGFAEDLMAARSEIALPSDKWA